MRKAVQSAYRPAAALLHVHTHGGGGKPGFSRVDLDSADDFVPGFFETTPRMPHGLLVLSNDAGHGLLWLANDRAPVAIDHFQRIDAPTQRECLRCLQLVTDERLKAEAQRYGVAGSRPQVVWPNGLLASTAVGLVVQLLTPWMSGPPRSAYLAYDANLGTMAPSDRLARRRGKPCLHYPAKAVGDPMFDVRRYLERLDKPPSVEPLVGVPVSRAARILDWFGKRFGRG